MTSRWMAGSTGMIGEQKVARLRRKAMLNRLPMIWLLDSAGARIQEAAGSTFAGSGAPFLRAGADERPSSAGGRPIRSCAAGTRLHSGAGPRLRPMGQGHQQHVARPVARLVRARPAERDHDHGDMGREQVHCYVSGGGGSLRSPTYARASPGSRLPVLHAVEQPRAGPRRETPIVAEPERIHDDRKIRAHQPTRGLRHAQRDHAPADDRQRLR